MDGLQFLDKFILYADVITAVRGLASESCENHEYDRALWEVVARMFPLTGDTASDAETHRLYRSGFSMRDPLFHAEYLVNTLIPDSIECGHVGHANDHAVTVCHLAEAQMQCGKETADRKARWHTVQMTAYGQYMRCGHEGVGA